MSFLEKIRSLPEKQRRIIFWIIIIIVAVLLLFFWGRTAQEKFGSFNKESLLEGLNFPDINVPDIPDNDLEEIKQLLEEINNAQKATTTTE